MPIQTTVAVVMPLFSNYRQLLRYYIISYDVAGVFNVIKTSNVAIPWIENRLRFSVVGREFSGACSVSSGSGEDAFLRQNNSHFNGIKFT